MLRSNGMQRIRLRHYSEITKTSIRILCGVVGHLAPQASQFANMYTLSHLAYTWVSQMKTLNKLYLVFYWTRKVHNDYFFLNWKGYVVKYNYVN